MWGLKFSFNFKFLSVVIVFLSIYLDTQKRTCKYLELNFVIRLQLGFINISACQIFFHQYFQLVQSDWQLLTFILLLFFALMGAFRHNERLFFGRSHKCFSKLHAQTQKIDFTASSKIEYFLIIFLFVIIAVDVVTKNIKMPALLIISPTVKAYCWDLVGISR